MPAKEWVWSGSWTPRELLKEALAKVSSASSKHKWKYRPYSIHSLKQTSSAFYILNQLPSDQQMFLLTEDCLQYQKWCPYKEWLLHPFVLAQWEMVKPVLTKACLQPTKTAAMCTAYYKCARSPRHPISPYPPFCLRKSCLQNGLRQLVTTSQSQTMPKSVLSG